MAFIYNKPEEQKQQEPPAAPIPDPVVVKPTFAPTPVFTSENVDNSGNYILLVNGKQKIVSKKSSYLLDMLTIGDE